MRETIPKILEGFKNIEPGELTFCKITERDRELLKRFAKEYNSKSTIPVILAIFVGIAIPILAFMNYESLDTETIEFCIAFCAFFYLVAFLVLRNRIKPSSPLKGIQSGFANGVWSMRSGSNTSSITYYIDVVFPDEKKRIKKVICLEDDYNRINQGDEILVFTFDGKRAFGCRVQK